MAKVTNASDVSIQENEYDGLNRRIVKTVGADTYDYYYNRQWQVIEVRKNGDIDPEKQYFYHPYYVDAVAVRYYDENTGGAIGDIVNHYYLQDANFNVTAVTDNTGAVVERYAYTPYGEVTFLDSSFITQGSSLINNEILYTGRRLDPETGLQLNRIRFYGSHIGRWLNRDPIGYWGGDANLYGYVFARPTRFIDPIGLWGWDNDWIELGLGGLLGLQGEDVLIAAGQAVIDSPIDAAYVGWADTIGGGENQLELGFVVGYNIEDGGLSLSGYLGLNLSVPLVDGSFTFGGGLTLSEDGLTPSAGVVDNFGPGHVAIDADGNVGIGVNIGPVFSRSRSV